MNEFPSTTTVRSCLLDSQHLCLLLGKLGLGCHKVLVGERPVNRQVNQTHLADGLKVSLYPVVQQIVDLVHQILQSL